MAEASAAGTGFDRPLGRFAWFELMTTDVDAAREFYTAIAGWSTSLWEGGSGPYEMWMNGETAVAGLMELPQPEVPPCWLAYVSTPDLGVTLAKVRDLGGSVLNEMAVPEVGRFAVVADPQGGVIAAIEPEGDASGHDEAPGVGEFSWCELTTTDPEGAWSFYAEVFGWEDADTMDLGEMGIYQMFSRRAHPLGGIYRAPEGVPTGWLCYVRVPDAKAAAEQVKKLGGAIHNGPVEVPGGDLVAQGVDSQGVAFAVHSTA